MKSSLIFLLSLIACGLMLLVERAVGIDWDFHPDAVTYLETYREMSMSLIDGGVMAVPNNFYYLVAYAAGGSFTILLLINIVVYSLTNVLVASVFKRYWKSQGGAVDGRYMFFLLLLLATPYRLHLAVHILKDTLIIGALCWATAGLRWSWLGWIPLLLLRVFSALYIFPLLKRKYYAYALVPILIALVFLNSLDLLGMLVDRNDGLEMSFREFDNVPNFAQFGLGGILLRSVVWPVFVLSGAFIVISPSVAYMPIALGAFLLQFWCWRVMRCSAFTVGAFVAMMIIALVVNGFTSYIRYCYPITVVIPMLLMRMAMAKARREQGAALNSLRTMESPN